MTTSSECDPQHLKEIFARQLERLKYVSSDTTEYNPTINEMTQSRVVGSEPIDRNYEGIIDLVPPTSPASSKPQSSLHALQEWEGYVVEIGSTQFVAHLIDITSGDSSCANEEAVIPNEEISEHDAEKMQIGSIFRWVIGYERSFSGTKKLVSQIVFRDLPAVTEFELKQSDAWAKVTVQSLTP